MKLIAPLTLLALLLTGCASISLMAATPTPLPTSTPTPDPKSWQLVWAEEFDLPDGSPPDPGRWNHQEGGNGWGNAELEYYTTSTENAFIQDGMLVIRAKKEYMLGRDYTSARLNTQFKAGWTYGRFEMRAKLPNTPGIWPAFWMMPARANYGNWPASGEIDILEMIGKEPGRAYGTLHFGNPHTFKSGTYNLPNGANFSDDFHTFAVEWEPDEFRWYVDDVLYHRVDTWFTSGRENAPQPAPFDQEFYLLLNVAVGGHWPGNPAETSVFPQDLLVDYVRVYQHPK